MISRHSARAISTFPLVNEIPWLKKLWVVMIFLFLLGPGLFAIPIGDFHITPFRMLMPIYLYLFLLTFFLYQGRMSLNTKVGKYLLFLALWLLWAVVSLFWAPPYIGAARHIVALVSGILLIVFSLFFLNTERGIRSIYGLWLVFTIVVIGVGIWEVATGTHLSVSREAQWVGIRETYPSAVFVNPNDFATFLSLSFPFMFILLGFLKRALPKALGAMLILASFYFIVQVSSRANIIALLIGICLIFLLPQMRAKFKSIATVLAIVGVIVFLGYALASPAISSFFDLFRGIPQQIASISPSDTSIMIRINLIRNGLVFLQDSHFLGVGAGSLEYWMEYNQADYTWGLGVMHNWWMEILTDYGVLVFTLFLAFYISLLWNLFRISRKSESPVLKAVSLATFIALAEFSVACLSSSGIIGSLFVWWLFATALCTINYYRLQERVE